jgi:hypothetical protein
MSYIGDSPWVCPSCGNFLGGYKKNSNGSVVVSHGDLRYNGSAAFRNGYEGTLYHVDVVRCEDCGVVFAVDPATVPVDDA